MNPLSTIFRQNKLIKTFGEFSLFTGLSSIPSNAFYYTSLEKITLPSNIRTINQSAFQNSPIEDIIIPEGVTTINRTAFERYSLNTTGRTTTRVVLPSTITSLYAGAIGYVYATKYVVAKMVTATSSTPFTAGIGSIYVPDNSISDYQSKWTNVKNNIKGFSQFVIDFPDDAEELGLV